MNAGGLDAGGLDAGGLDASGLEDDDRMFVQTFRGLFQCKIDVSPIRRLFDIFDGSESARWISLFKILNKTRTAWGERLLKVWLWQPLTSKEKICQRLDLVKKLLNGCGARKTLHESALWGFRISSRSG